MAKKRLLCLLAVIGFLAALAVFLMMVLPRTAAKTPSTDQSIPKITTEATTEATTLPTTTETEPPVLTFGYEGDYLT